MSRATILASGFAMVLVAASVACSGSDDGGSNNAGTGGGSAGTGGSSATGGGAGAAGSTGGTGTGGTSATGGTGTGGSGTGGTSATGGTGGGTIGTCAAACAHVAEANCPNEDDAATCTSNCEKNTSTLTSCTEEFGAFMGCSESAQVTCDQDGNATMPGCDPQRAAFSGCVVCLSDPNDDACTACLKGGCCDELKTAALDKDMSPYIDCIKACSDQPCMDECGTQYPTAAAALNGLGVCQQSKCSADCQ